MPERTPHKSAWLHPWKFSSCFVLGFWLGGYLTPAIFVAASWLGQQSIFSPSGRPDPISQRLSSLMTRSCPASYRWHIEVTRLSFTHSSPFKILCSLQCRRLHITFLSNDWEFYGLPSGYKLWRYPWTVMVSQRSVIDDVGICERIMIFKFKQGLRAGAYLSMIFEF